MAAKPKMSVEDTQAPAEPEASEELEQKEDLGAWESLSRWLKATMRGHENAWIGGVCGFIIALLFLGIGFWPTLLILICVLIGVLVGQALDGNPKILKILRQMFSDNR